MEKGFPFIQSALPDMVHQFVTIRVLWMFDIGDMLASPLLDLFCFSNVEHVAMSAYQNVYYISTVTIEIPGIVPLKTVRFAEVEITASSEITESMVFA